MSLTIIRPSAHRRMRWKNGQGETAEIAVEPNDAGFLWRLSIAHIARSGAFWAYPGIERWITVLDGNGMRLSVGDAEPRIMRALDPPACFAGEAGTRCELLDGAIHDINPMLDRRYVEGRMFLLSGRGEHRLDGGTVLLYAATKGVMVATGIAERVELAAGDTAMLGAAGGVSVLEVRATAIVAQIGRRAPA